MASRRAACVVALLLLVLAGCSTPHSGPSQPPPGSTIRIASYDFVESQVLAEVYAEAIRRAGLPVEVHHGVGTREVVEPALEQGVVDVVVDYLGTALAFVRPEDPPGFRGTGELRADLAQALAERGVSVLDLARAEDQNGFAVTTSFALGHHLRTLSDLVPLAAGLTLGGPPECPERPLCQVGLREVYGLNFARFRPMASRAATAEALKAGEIDVGMLETTDARLGTEGITQLADDRGLQPHENLVPLVRTAVLERSGARLRTALDQVSARITTDDLRRLNRSVEVDGLSPAAAAARWWSG